MKNVAGARGWMPGRFRGTAIPAALCVTALLSSSAAQLLPAQPEAAPLVASGFRCAERIEQFYSALPADDKFKHCAASAKIYEACGAPMAYVAGVATEVGDAFTPGSAELADLGVDASVPLPVKRRNDGRFFYTTESLALELIAALDGLRLRTEGQHGSIT